MCCGWYVPLLVTLPACWAECLFWRDTLCSLSWINISLESWEEIKYLVLRLLSIIQKQYKMALLVEGPVLRNCQAQENTKPKKTQTTNKVNCCPISVQPPVHSLLWESQFHTFMSLNCMCYPSFGLLIPDWLTIFPWYTLALASTGKTLLSGLVLLVLLYASSCQDSCCWSL